MIIYIFLYILHLRLDTGAVFCYNGICIVTDTEDIADTFRNVVKYILSLKENSDENK